MNKRRRKTLNDVLDSLERLREQISNDTAIEVLIQAQKDVQLCCDEEEMALDNRPESLMWTTASDDMTENISDLCEASGELEVLIEECRQRDDYSYEYVKNSIIEIVNLIKQSIHR